METFYQYNSSNFLAKFGLDRSSDSFRIEIILNNKNYKFLYNESGNFYWCLIKGKVIKVNWKNPREIILELVKEINANTIEILT